MLINCEPSERYAVESQLLSQDLYDDGVTDGSDGTPPKHRGSLEYLQGYADGCRMAFERVNKLLAEFQAETAWVDEF
ncbi:MAG: hypothetical protein NW220_16875 [Leptolyngbyaceae cyanobacterium bins.349]|nr:hypothetical protein [Leptolyngbyaceae cyanobacterium bins.349]